MITILNIAGLVLIGLMMISGILRLFDIATDVEDKRKLKARIERFWMETSDINLADQLSRSLAARYEATGALRHVFLRTFWMICTIVALFVAIQSASQNSAGGFRGLLQLNFSTRYAIQCTYTLLKEKRTEAKDYCDPDKNPNGPSELQYLRDRFSNVDAFIVELADHPVLMAAAIVFSEILKVLIVVVPLSYALLISFNVTLRLLRKVTGSRIWYAFLFLIALTVAVTVPPVLTSLMTLIFWAVSIFAVGQGLDFFTFPITNWPALAAGSALTTLSIEYIFPVLVLVSAVAVSGAWGFFIAAVLLLINPILMADIRIHALPNDLRGLFDFTFGAVDACIDVAIVLDVIFSLTYLVPSFALVLANRSDRSRKIFLNVAQWVHDHRNGPFVAIAELAESFVRIFKR